MLCQWKRVLRKRIQLICFMLWYMGLNNAGGREVGRLDMGCKF